MRLGPGHGGFKILAGAPVEMRVNAAIDAVAKLGCGFDRLESLLRDTAADKDAPATRRRYLPRERRAGPDRIDNSLRQGPLPIRPRPRRRADGGGPPAQPFSSTLGASGAIRPFSIRNDDKARPRYAEAQERRRGASPSREAAPLSTRRRTRRARPWRALPE